MCLPHPCRCHNCRTLGFPQPRAALQGPSDSKCSYCLYVWTAGPSAWGCSGLAVFMEEPPQEGRKGVGLAFLGLLGFSRPTLSQYCAVSCFNKGPQGPTWALTTCSGRDRCSQIHPGARAPSLPKCQRPQPAPLLEPTQAGFTENIYYDKMAEAIHLTISCNSKLPQSGGFAKVRTVAGGPWAVRDRGRIGSCQMTDCQEGL